MLHRPKVSVLSTSLKLQIIDVFGRSLPIALHYSNLLSHTVLPFFATFDGLEPALACVITILGWWVQEQFLGPSLVTQADGHFKFLPTEGVVNSKYMGAYRDV